VILKERGDLVLQPPHAFREPIDSTLEAAHPFREPIDPPAMLVELTAVGSEDASVPFEDKAVHFDDLTVALNRPAVLLQDAGILVETATVRHDALGHDPDLAPERFFGHAHQGSQLHGLALELFDEEIREVLVFAGRHRSGFVGDDCRTTSRADQVASM